MSSSFQVWKSRKSDSEANSNVLTFIFHMETSKSLGSEECLERSKCKSNAPFCKHQEVKNVLLHHGDRERSSDEGNVRGHVTRRLFVFPLFFLAQLLSTPQIPIGDYLFEVRWKAKFL